MALAKLELLPLPALREIGERLWFKIELDSKGWIRLVMRTSKQRYRIRL